MRHHHLITTIILIGFLPMASFAQNPPINFHHLTVKQGLIDGNINGVCEDKYGYIWLASAGGLNRFDGVSSKKFTHKPGDTTSIRNAVLYALEAGNDDRLWLGYPDGLFEFNSRTAVCRPVPELEGIYIHVIVKANNNKLYMATGHGLKAYDPSTKKEDEVFNNRDTAIQDLIGKQTYWLCSRGNELAIASYNRIIVYDILTKRAKAIDLPDLQGRIDRIGIDQQGYFWISCFQNFKLWRVSPDGKNVEVLDHLLTSSMNKAPSSSALGFCADGSETVWIITSVNGLIEYNITTNKGMYHQHNDQLPTSIMPGVLRNIYRDKAGRIWVGTGWGTDYFHPQKNLFKVIFPFADEKELKYARGVAEDHKNNFWFTTGTGISYYDLRSGSYKVWRNDAGEAKKIYYNSVRGVAEDNEHRIWIATGEGVNRLNSTNGKMEFLTIKDSLPQAFYFNAVKLTDSSIWFATRDYDGFYYYSPLDKKVHGIASDPALKIFSNKGGRYAFLDSKKRLWLGFNGNGLGMYDPVQNNARFWSGNDKNADETIAGDLIVDIKEDKNGVIWVSSFGGVTGIDLEHNRYYKFTDRNGLKSNIAGPIAIDARNRLWIGTAAGMALLDSSRNYFTYFGEENGLAATAFSENPAIYTSNGDIVFPSLSGYIYFNPLDYHEADPKINFYVSSFQKADKNYPLEDHVADRPVMLKADENFFSIDLVGINYENPSQTWYAYILDGFEKKWHFTKDAHVVYTNVPGGKYVFRYKATANVNYWDVPEKTLAVHIDTVFYKATWFWILVGVVVITFLYFFYRNRIRHQQQLLSLHSKAQALEKEKALVMYEGLKQQLNPHFLFNSLTSLNSLINADPKVASEFLDSLSKTYRYILKSRDNETVSLADEIKFAENYVRLQQTRFEKGFEVNINVNGEHDHSRIVPVTLQNLIENAIKHNIIDEDSPLKVDIYIEQDRLVVRNNIQKKNFVETSNKQGLSNLVSLYHYLSNQSMEIKEDSNYFTVKIPLL